MVGWSFFRVLNSPFSDRKSGIPAATETPAPRTHVRRASLRRLSEVQYGPQTNTICFALRIVSMIFFMWISGSADNSRKLGVEGGASEGSSGTNTVIFRRILAGLIFEATAKNADKTRDRDRIKTDDG